MPATFTSDAKVQQSERASSVLILACGALAREIRDITRLNQLPNVTLECLPASWHNHPHKIGKALRSRLAKHHLAYEKILIGYADCGTKDEIKDICAEFQQMGVDIEMMPGAHCYQFFLGQTRFDEIHNNDPTAFYLTDYLVKHFERIIMGGLGIAKHPELRDMYFGNYTKVIYLAQTTDPSLDTKARAAAKRLSLEYERIDTGYNELESEILEFTALGGRR